MNQITQLFLINSLIGEPHLKLLGGHNILFQYATHSVQVHDIQYKCTTHHVLYRIRVSGIPGIQIAPAGHASQHQHYGGGQCYRLFVSEPGFVGSGQNIREQN